MKYIASSIEATFSLLLKQIKQRIQGRRALPHIDTRALQQPHVQYHAALLLVTVLAFLLGWPLYLSTLPHIQFALLGHL